MARAVASMKMVHIDTAGPYQESLGGSRYVVIFVESASCLQRPYGTRDKSASVILSIMKRLVADMGVLVRSGPTTALSTPTQRLLVIAMVSESAPSWNPHRANGTVHAPAKGPRV